MKEVKNQTFYDELHSAPGRTITLEGGAEKVRASFRLFHEDLDPRTVSEAFDLQPTKSHRKGDPRVTRKGRVLSPYSKGSWRLNSETSVNGTDVNKHINWLLDQLCHHTGELHRLQDMGYYSDIMCYWLAKTDNTCPQLNVDTMRRLAHMRLTCWFDVYMYDDEDGA